MVTERAAWSERTADWLRTVIAAERPLLGICYGHQLIAHALGGEVAYNPRGYEAGTIQVHLHPEAATDPLLQGLPNPLPAHAVHAQTVLKLPSAAVCLSHSAQDQHQAFRVGACCWGVQFHPEFDSNIMRHYLQERSVVLQQHQQDPVALLANVTDCPHSVQVLRRFAATLLE
jgi:GMP synthase (glutamine-hydrolysing)